LRLLEDFFLVAIVWKILPNVSDAGYIREGWLLPERHGAQY